MSRIASRLRQRELEREHYERVRHAVEAGEDVEVLPNPRALPGDPARIRGIPAHMSGTSAALDGSDPLRALLRKEAREERRLRGRNG